MRKALCVGIDYYERCGCLNNCVSDAESVRRVLEYHANGDRNFEVISLTARIEEVDRPVSIDPFTGEIVYKKQAIASSVNALPLKDAVEDLFDPDKQLDVVLFYFAGHGSFNANGGFLCASDTVKASDGLSLDYLMKLVSNCKAKNKIIILDSCHSGNAGKFDKANDICMLPENTIIMAACTERGTAADGCFTPLMIEALEGGAMNLMGEVSPGGIYSYIDRALGAFDQRPVFKANIENFVCLRKNDPPIKIGDLREITSIFPNCNEDKPLDPGYESDKHEVTDERYLNNDQEKERVFAILRKYYALNLVVPVDAPYMYQAAIYSKACRLTTQGRYFWKLVKENKI